MTHPTLEQFLKDVASHELTVNLDQGLFRDLTIMKPNSVDMHYHITTRPDYLMFTGDMGSFVFTRLNDMFNFFRSKDEYRINTGYWAEKIEAGEYEKYSPDAARAALNQAFENWKEDTDFSVNNIAAEKEYLDEIDTDDYYEFIEVVRNWTPNRGGVDLDDFWENNLNEYTFHYIWCCYAIVYAIKLYDAHKNKEVAQ